MGGRRKRNCEVERKIKILESNLIHRSSTINMNLIVRNVSTFEKFRRSITDKK